MSDDLKLRFRTARRVFTYVTRAVAYFALILGGLAALIAPPDTIIDSMGSLFVLAMGVCMLLGGLASAIGWLVGRWEPEQYGVVIAAAGVLIYIWATTLTPEVVTLGGGVRLSIMFFGFLTLVTRILEIERYTSVSFVRNRMRLERR